MALKSRVYFNSSILDVFKDQYLRVIAVNLLGEGPLSNYILFKGYKLVPEWLDNP